MSAAVVVRSESATHCCEALDSTDTLSMSNAAVVLLQSLDSLDPSPLLSPWMGISVSFELYGAFGTYVVAH